MRAKGEAQAKAYRDQVDALTAQGVTTVEVMKAISTAGLKITPDILVGGSGDGADGGGLVQVLLAQLIRQQRSDVVRETATDAAPAAAALPPKNA